MTPQRSIGRAELEILRYIADHNPITVREVAEHVSKTKGHVRTTVLNVMERLREKGFLTRKRVRGLFRYSPYAPKPQLLRNIVRNFVETALGGSVVPFFAYLAKDSRLNEAELREVRELVKALEARRAKSSKR